MSFYKSISTLLILNLLWTSSWSVAYGAISPAEKIRLGAEYSHILKKVQAWEAHGKKPAEQEITTTEIDLGLIDENSKPIIEQLKRFLASPREILSQSRSEDGNLIFRYCKLSKDYSTRTFVSSSRYSSVNTFCTGLGSGVVLAALTALILSAYLSAQSECVHYQEGYVTNCYHAYNGTYSTEPLSATGGCSTPGYSLDFSDLSPVIPSSGNALKVCVGSDGLTRPIFNNIAVDQATIGVAVGIIVLTASAMGIQIYWDSIRRVFMRSDDSALSQFEFQQMLMGIRRQLLEKNKLPHFERVLEWLETLPQNPISQALTADESEAPPQVVVIEGVESAEAAPETIGMGGAGAGAPAGSGPLESSLGGGGVGPTVSAVSARSIPIGSSRTQRATGELPALLPRSAIDLDASFSDSLVVPIPSRRSAVWPRRPVEMVPTRQVSDPYSVNSSIGVVLPPRGQGIRGSEAADVNERLARLRRAILISQGQGARGRVLEEEAEGSGFEADTDGD